jgi:hypothetical protein
MQRSGQFPQPGLSRAGAVAERCVSYPEVTRSIELSRLHCRSKGQPLSINEPQHQPCSVGAVTHQRPATRRARDLDTTMGRVEASRSRWGGFVSPYVILVVVTVALALAKLMIFRGTNPKTEPLSPYPPASVRCRRQRHDSLRPLAQADVIVAAHSCDAYRASVWTEVRIASAESGPPWRQQMTCNLPRLVVKQRGAQGVVKGAQIQRVERPGCDGAEGAQADGAGGVGGAVEKPAAVMAWRQAPDDHVGGGLAGSAQGGGGGVTDHLRGGGGIADQLHGGTVQRFVGGVGGQPENPASGGA